MPPFPLDLPDLFGHWESYIVYLIIGFGFGYVLEIAGFGNSQKLANQFYFKDMTVLKVMFSAIVVAMALIFLTTALGWLDYNLIWVNPTYLWPGIVGGLVMGIGFIIGGFCPGTSLVSAVTLKLDGIMFVAGVFFGIFLFGETVGGYEDFWYSSYLGRYTLMDLFDVSTGVIVFVIIVGAVMAFWAAEHAERIFGGIDRRTLPRWRYAAAAGLVALAAIVMIIGQPTTEDRWNAIASEQNARLVNREVQIHPGELLNLIYDRRIKVVMLDVRSEADYNLFHIQDARHVDDIGAELDELREEAANNVVFVTISNDEAAATDAWKVLVAQSIPNAYILEGGINNWIDIFGTDEFTLEDGAFSRREDELKYVFSAALGARYPAAAPRKDQVELEYEPKVVLQTKRGASGGGCG